MDHQPEPHLPTDNTAHQRTSGHLHKQPTATTTRSTVVCLHTRETRPPTCRSVHQHHHWSVVFDFIEDLSIILLCLSVHRCQSGGLTPGHRGTHEPCCFKLMIALTISADLCIQVWFIYWSLLLFLTENSQSAATLCVHGSILNNPVVNSFICVDTMLSHISAHLWGCAQFNRLSVHLFTSQALCFSNCSLIQWVINYSINQPGHKQAKLQLIMTSQHKHGSDWSRADLSITH